MSPKALDQNIVPLSNVLGYDNELADALSRYANARPKRTSDESSEIITKSFSDWMRKCPHANHLCFADITYFGNDTALTVRDALTLVFTPETDSNSKKFFENYSSTLHDEFFVARETSLAIHRMFQLGIPYSNAHGTGYNVSPKNHFLYGTVLLNGTQQISSYHEEAILHNPDEQIANGSMLIYCSSLDDTYGKKPLTEERTEAISSQDLGVAWEAWRSTWSTPKGQNCLSTEGLPPYHLIAAPVGFRTSHDPNDFLLVACVFVAFDSLLEVDQVYEAMRYILLNLYEANATSFISRRAELAGREAALLPASHETRRVVKAISPTASPRAIKAIGDYLNEVLVTITSQSPAETSDYDSAGDTEAQPDVVFDIQAFVSECVKQSAEIEAVIRTAEPQLLSKGHEEEGEKVLDEWSELIVSKTQINVEPQIWHMAKRSREVFKVAVTGALRNAINHTFLYTNPEIFISITVEDETIPLLVIENQFSARYPSKIQPHKLHGTFSSLKAYVRSYRADPRYVSLELTKSVSDDNKTRELWMTKIPIPHFRLDSSK